MGLQDISLRWKLLAAFLLLSFAGTTTLVLIAFRSEHALIHLSERQALEAHYLHLLHSVQGKRDQALSLAWTIALDPHVQEFFAARDRKALLEHLRPMHRRIRDQFGVRQLHFHVPPATSFLRVHRPEQFGEHMEAYRPTILHAVATRQGVGGLEWGATGYGIRGVVPVEFAGALVGTVEVGFSFASPFVEEFKAKYGCDLTIYVPDVEGGEQLSPLATTLAVPRRLDLTQIRAFEERPAPVTWMPLPEREDVSSLLGPVRDFSERVVGLVEIRIDRTPTLSLLQRYRTEMAFVEVIALALATLVVWWVVDRFLRRIREMVRGATEIASGERLHIAVSGTDEMGRLARALNSMVGYLEASRARAKDYARNLEQEVETRTRELRLSEERYRTLVETVPLVVYQMTPKERTLTFVNGFVAEMLGVQPHEILGRPGALDRLIHPADRDHVLSGFQQAMAAAMEWIAEYRIEAAPGRTCHVREHAVPVLDEDGRVRRADGILVDFTDQKALQEKILQAEELKTLGEVSARLAHEIRNPLTSIGGLSRRLLKELPKDDQAREWIRVIVEEVQRLEGILQMILSYIQPVEVQLTPGDLRSMMEGLLQGLAGEFSSRNQGLSWSIPPALPRVHMDPALLRRAMVSLCRHPLFHMDQGGALRVTVAEEAEGIAVRLRYPSSTLSADDLDHYFYPFLAQGPPDPSLLDLPVAKTILHKHGGLVLVEQRAENEIALSVTLPIAPDDAPSRPPEIR